MDWKISEEPVGYEEALAYMDARVAAIHAGAAPDQVWLLEHPSLYTGGTSAKAEDLLEARFPVHSSGRGGEYTYHGPGQRVAYVMMDLKAKGAAPDIKDYVWRLEEWIIRSIAEFGIKGERRCGRVGIWVVMPDGAEKKIAAIGVRVRHWITLHGIAINVNPELAHFGGIVPCGIADAGVTSFADLNVSAGFSELDAALRKNFDAVFDGSLNRSCA